MTNIGRNDPCPCNSGKKFKKCCGQPSTKAANTASGAISYDPLRIALEHHQAGRLSQAETLYQQLLQTDPRNPSLLNFLGVLNYQRGNSAAAISLYLQALSVKSDYAEAHYNLGLALQAQASLNEAAASYRHALLYQPNYAEAHNNLGTVLYDLDNPEQAATAYRTALELRPGYAEAHNNLGNALIKQGKPTEATSHYRQALLYRPNYAEAHNNLGFALHELGNPDAAISHYRQAIRLDANYSEAHNNLGNTLKDQGKIDEAIACYHQALHINPDYAKAHNNLGLALQDQGKLDSAMACYRQALKIQSDYAEAHSNHLFCLNYHPDISAEDIFAEYQRWSELHASALYPQTATYPHNRNPDRRLRIGYMSPDLRKHASLHFIEPLFDHHDKTKFKIYAYAHVAVEDNISTHLKKYVDHWQNTSGVNDDKMAEMIRSDRIDILVDLAGHTANNRLRVFARKPAPIQVSWMGFGYTTGLRTIDYFLSDHEFTPPGCDALFSEKLVRLPVAGVYRPAQGMGELGLLPASQNGIITLGSLSRSIRINHRVISAWAAILQQLPSARLVINSVNFQDESIKSIIQERFSTHGIATNRLVMGFQTPPWDVLRQIDISLDCFPHNSGTTLMESLYMGIPFITLAGRLSIGRSGSVALMKINHPEWIATTEQEYVEKVVTLASNLDALTVLRAKLRSEMQASLLMNERSFAGSLETAYRTMWQRWCEDLPPAALDITGHEQSLPTVYPA